MEDTVVAKIMLLTFFIHSIKSSLVWKLSFIQRYTVEDKATILLFH